MITPSLGRDLAGGARTRTVPLVEPGTLYNEPRSNQLDFRVTRVFRFNNNANTVRLQPQLDLYNLFNANSVLVQSNAYGPAWQGVRGILAGRLVKFGVQVDF